MIYKHREFREDTSPREYHPIKESTYMLLGVTCFILASLAITSLFIDRLVVYLPYSWERKLVGTFEAVRHKPQNKLQESQQQSLNALFETLLTYSPSELGTLKVGLLDVDQPNAIALPGGMILVTTGLMSKVRSQNELAFVLGHELGHYQARDHLRNLGRGIAISIILTTIGVGQATGELTVGPTQLAARKFNRLQESDADAFGLRLVAEMFGHVGGATDYFERLPDPNSALNKTIASYLSTHPLNEERITQIKHLAIQRGWRSNGKPVSISETF